MARIAGVDLPREKRVEIALTYIFGIGLPTSRRILDKTAVSPSARVRDLTDSEVARLRQIIERGREWRAVDYTRAVVGIEPDPACEGEEYEIVIRFGTKAVASEEAEVTVLIRRVGGDGSESEVELEGTLGDVAGLLERVGSEGDCVAVRFEPAGEEGSAPGAADAPEAAAGPEEELEPALS